MDATAVGIDIEKDTAAQPEDYVKLRSAPILYAGRLGGNQEFVLDPSHPDAEDILNKTPDAVPLISWRAIFSFSGFQEASLWKAAIIEGIGTLNLCYVTILLNASPPLNVVPLPKPTGAAGPFGTTVFLGPLVGAISNVIFIALFIYTFGAVTGGHLNPLITIATFTCRLTTFPRLVLYVGFQTAGAGLAGLLVRASFNSTTWKTGGCFFDPNLVSTGQMFTIEYAASLTLIFLAFGVGLDPRQASVFGPAMAPALVGFVVGVITITTAFSVPGYGGAGTNPGRCFGVWLGSGRSLGVTGANPEFGYSGRNGDRMWVHWVAAITASVVHSIFYQLVPPWSNSGTGNLGTKKPNRSRG